MNHRLAAAAAFAILLAASTPALALGAIVTSPAGASAAVSVREAVSASAGRTVRWGSVEVRGTASTVAWIIPARQGAALDLASDAWLEALEAASAPRVVPPDVTPPCGIPGGVEVEGDFTHTVTAAPGTVAVAGDRASLDVALTGFGLTLTSNLAPSVDAAFANGEAVVVLVYTDVSTDLVTKTVRVVDTSAATLPLALIESETTPLSITAFAFGDGSVAVGEQAPVTMNASDVVWRSDGTSSYASVRDTLLAASPGAWLFETGGHDLVFDGVPVPGGTTTPALTTSYFFRAASYADATGAPGGCTDETSTVAQSDATVATACPAGSLAHVGASSCQEIVAAGEVDPSTLRCGGIADDLAMALSGLAPGRTWITRVRGALQPWTTGQDANLGGATAAGPYGPVVTASGYAEPCEAAPGSPGGTGTTGSGQTSQGSTGASGTGSEGSGGAGDPGGSAGGVIVAVSAAQTVGTIADSSEGCGGDSSDTSDGCSGDSSSSSDDASGCDGSADDGSGCAVAPHRRGWASRIALLLVAAATLARRRQRRTRHQSLPAAQ